MSPPDSHEATGLHPTARPVEKRRDIRFEEKDIGLRKDVHALGIMVGGLLREQGGDPLFDFVEEARRNAIRRREGEVDASAALNDLISSVSVEVARDVIRAFSTYFQVVNAAEQVHRIRRRRDYLRDSASPQPGGIEDCICILEDRGLSLDTVFNVLQKLRIEPVFTAHPTEPVRRTILRKQQNIIKRLVEVQNPVLTPQEREACFESIHSDITAIWQTEESPNEERTVFDEMEHMLFYFTDVIYRALPVFYETLERVMHDSFGDEAAQRKMPTMLHFASWIGGDMDSRPEITARTIRETLARQRSLILDLYFNECRVLAEKLSQSTSRVDVSRELLERIQLYSGQFRNTAGKVPLRHREMPYRIFLRLVMERLQSTYNDDIYPYEQAEEFLGDLQLISDSLAANNGRFAGLFSVKRLMRRVETFGFHFLTLDIRQDSARNRTVVGRCLGEPNWLDKSIEYRVERIRRALKRNESPTADLDNASKRSLAVFQSIAYCRRKYGKRAVGPYVVSLAHGIDDILSVILMARWGDLGRRNGSVPLDIAPSFETVDDLTQCRQLMETLLEDPLYREHLAGRKNRQTVMVSYSDSNKDAGLASARWSLHQAQSALVAAAEQFGVELTLFHGRGGTISRGGGKTHAAVLGSPTRAIRGRLRATEQGELVNAKYGVRGIALRTLEQAVGSVLLGTAWPRRRESRENAEWREMMELITSSARDQYQKMVYDSDDFYRYFRLATPVEIIESLRIGPDRPTVENMLDKGSVDNLKYIPWDFSWAQSRHMLPGWFGIGTALANAIDRFGFEAVREMATSWYFFRTLIDDVETVLAKCDLNIAARYSALAGDLHDKFFPVMRTEFDLSVEKVLALKGQQVLLERNNALRRSIRLRNPYVDPMSMLQVELLQRWRSGHGDRDMLLSALVASVNGIARGLQDSG